MALVSRAGWAGVGGYSTARIGWEDSDLWCLFAERGLKGERVPGEPLAEYRVHGNSMTSTFMKKVEKVRWMMSYVQSRHAWLTLISPIPKPIEIAEKFARKDARLNAVPLDGPADQLRRTKIILPLLRCPVTGGALSLANNNQELVSENGKQRWSMLEGVPVLYPEWTNHALLTTFI